LLGIAILFPSQCYISISSDGGGGLESAFFVSAFSPSTHQQNIFSPPPHCDITVTRQRRQLQHSCYHSLPSSAIPKLSAFHNHPTAYYLARRTLNIPTSTSSSSTRLQSFFGLGPAEIAIVALASVIVIGPTKLLNFSKEAGSIAGKTASSMGNEWSDELKNIPEEFRKGVEMGEMEARSRKAKVMENVEEGDDANM
jgi:Sec-independent protein translocase protein TatA